MAAAYLEIGSVKTMRIPVAVNVGIRTPHSRKSGCMETELRRASLVVDTRYPPLGISVFMNIFPHFEPLMFRPAGYFMRFKNLTRDRK